MNISLRILILFVSVTDGFLLHLHWAAARRPAIIVNRRPSFLLLSAPTNDSSISSLNSQHQHRHQHPQYSEPDMMAYASAYKTVFKELPFRICEPSVGSIPSDLQGTYYRAGPAMFSAGSIVPPKTFIVQPKQPPVPDGADPDRMVQHPFDGDGAVIGVTFSTKNETLDNEHNVAPTCTARYRFVRTTAFTNERKKGAKLYDGMESTRAMSVFAGNGLGNDYPIPLFTHHLQAGLNKFRKNTSNLRTIYWGKRLMTLWESGLPYKLDARALQTEGKSQLGGAILKETNPFGGKMVVSGDRALFHAVEQDFLGNSKLTLYEFNQSFRLVDRQTVDLPGYALISDFAATANYAAFIAPAVTVKRGSLLDIGGSKEPGKALNLNANGDATVILVPRVGSNKDVMRIPLAADGLSDANLQFVNAYEEDEGGSGTIIIDCIRSDTTKLQSGEQPPLCWPWAQTLQEYQSSASAKSLWRYTVDLSTKTITRRLLVDTHCYFAGVNPSKSSSRHRYVYMNVGACGNDAAPPQGIAKVDVTKCADGNVLAGTWMPDTHEFCGEPMYASQAGVDESAAEDAGYILSVLYDGKRRESDLIVLEARNIAAGPITRIPLGIAIPHGHFGCFSSGNEVKWPAEELERRAKLLDKVESRGNRWNELKSDFSGLGLRFDDMEEYFGDFFS
ncbi:hypothetical protein MPSEU_000744600 [Mayamaea pseudoterrestris]|nr:hypothetical protein MPSEU_000744600 [Mayamaea pseudoterrestris]